MTDHTRETTPTRDEAMQSCLQALEFIAKYSNDSDASFRARRSLKAMLASAPAPASGRVDAVAIVKTIRPMECEATVSFTPGLNGSLPFDIGAKLSLSPAATPVSEAEPAAWRWRYEGEKSWCLRKSKPDEWPDVEMQPLYALAKPASSPAPVRPIGNQGISDYQREIARNMAEGFAAWNAARQEALPSDEPASSPAGGDVVQTLIDKTEKLIEAADDMGWSCNSSSADQAIREARDAVRAALSQSTSAGRVGDDSWHPRDSRARRLTPVSFVAYVANCRLTNRE